MAVLKLTLNDFFEEEDFTLIAIHCIIEQYRLAYLINKQLNISLVRTKNDVIQQKKQTHFALYKYTNDFTDVTYNVVENSCKVQTKKQDVSNLFSSESSYNESSSYLVPELKKVSYFLKINKLYTKHKTQVILNKILEIPQIITAYSVDSNNLKSKNNLIFN